MEGMDVRQILWKAVCQSYEQSVFQAQVGDIRRHRLPFERTHLHLAGCSELPEPERRQRRNPGRLPGGGSVSFQELSHIRNLPQTVYPGNVPEVVFVNSNLSESLDTLDLVELAFIFRHLS